MAEITLKGTPFHTVGELPAVGSDAPDFVLTGADLSPVALAALGGRKIVLNVFPSIDTPTCATSVRRFNELAGSRDNVTVICASMDLPFAAARFCGAEGIENVVTGSDFRNGILGSVYGVRIADGPLAGLLARSVVVIDEAGKVVHTQLVSEVADEPDYDAALAHL